MKLHLILELAQVDRLGRRPGYFHEPLEDDKLDFTGRKEVFLRFSEGHYVAVFGLTELAESSCSLLWAQPTYMLGLLPIAGSLTILTLILRTDFSTL